ncbi:class I SAM-dependent methyltransferase [Aureliella helgolandensis]|uniref:class I SAM-dependent methyltransferase n=1 Tax=Aureliella helgolandensis TaxID=2527968 RepID=UPI0018D062C2|nr:class I SAM-dependent methyltransferase [Aureliella helgolandensis]
MTAQPFSNSYDEVPYNSYPYALAHPDHIAMIAVLLRLNPPRRPYRVLELGCASGGNLIPIAASRPDCSFVGVDYSTRQIATGQLIVDQLRLTNIELLVQSILDVEKTIGRFDYILCHGVYSWVPSDVQVKILDLCRSLLTEQGIAYISYNTQPGWRQRGALRDMMQYHVGRSAGSSPAQRIDQARGLLDFLVNATSTTDNSYARMLREQQELLGKHSDSYIYHEHLERHNEPLWFLDFCHRLDQHGLRYLGEADFSSMVGSMSLTPELQQQLDDLAPDLTEKEQYIDFVRNRSFRQTLVCHARQRPNYAVRGERLRGLFAATPGRVQMNDGEGGEPKWRLVVNDDLSLSTDLRTTQIAFELLSQAWPERIPVALLVDQVAEQLNDPTLDRAELQRTLEVALLTAFSSSSGEVVELSVSPLNSMVDESENHGAPMVSRLVQLQAREGMPVVNRRHNLLPVMPLDRRILSLLDGTCDGEQLLVELLAQHQSGDLIILDEHDVPISDSAVITSMLRELVPQRMAHYHRGSLL